MGRDAVPTSKKHDEEASGKRRIGRRYSRAFVLDELERRYASPPLDDGLESCDFPLQRNRRRRLSAN